MTAFAGSIGIIGIAAILSLANGVNQYIANVEENTLSEYPLQIQDQGFDMTSMMTMGMAARRRRFRRHHRRANERRRALRAIQTSRYMSQR